MPNVMTKKTNKQLLPKGYCHKKKIEERWLFLSKRGYIYENLLWHLNCI